VLARVGEIEFDRLVRALLPFYFPIFIVLILCLFYAPLVTYLPQLVIAR
jgi:TRAP-type C4-dicarboxylate transport system permease large subunit